ncbi:MAG TPA: LacI family DNA-binding transcriptional regulator [Polyangia bacterium]
MAKLPTKLRSTSRGPAAPGGAVHIQEVARHAGVSTSTVSNVLNGRTQRMSAATFERVSASIRALNYHPNHSARLLRTGQTPMLGLLVPSIANPFFGALAREIDEAAQKRGYHLMLGNTYRDPNKEREFLEALMRYGVRGAIITSSLAKQSQFAELIERGMALVSFDRQETPEDSWPIDYVSIDNFHASEMATRHLLDHGHRDIAYVTAPTRTLSRLDRRAGYQSAMKRAGLARKAEIIEPDMNTPFADSEMAELGHRVAAEIAAKAERPTAIVTMNDIIAIGLMAALHQHGLRVPEDVSVVGIDDIYLDSLMRPALTSMRQPLPEIASTMIEKLSARLADPAAPASSHVFKADLVSRASVNRIAAE